MASLPTCNCKTTARQSASVMWPRASASTSAARHGRDRRGQDAMSAHTNTPRCRSRPCPCSKKLPILPPRPVLSQPRPTYLGALREICELSSVNPVSFSHGIRPKTPWLGLPCCADCKLKTMRALSRWLLSCLLVICPHYPHSPIRRPCFSPILTYTC